MKYLIFIPLFILSFNQLVFSQTVDKKNDSLVYSCIINQPGYNKAANKPICDTAYSEILKKFDLKKTDLNKWYGKEIVTGWKVFFYQINTDTLKDHRLTVNKIGDHPIIKRDLKKSRDYKHPFLYFSPIIYSPDKSLAVCSIRDYSGPDASGEEIYLLQFIDNKWRIVRFILVSIS